MTISNCPDNHPELIRFTPIYGKMHTGALGKYINSAPYYTRTTHRYCVLLWSANRTGCVSCVSQVTVCRSQHGTATHLQPAHAHLKNQPSTGPKRASNVYSPVGVSELLTV